MALQTQFRGHKTFPPPEIRFQTRLSWKYGDLVHSWIFSLHRFSFPLENWVDPAPQRKYSQIIQTFFSFPKQAWASEKKSQWKTWTSLEREDNSLRDLRKPDRMLSDILKINVLFRLIAGFFPHLSTFGPDQKSLCVKNWPCVWKIWMGERDPREVEGKAR